MSGRRSGAAPPVRLLIADDSPSVRLILSEGLEAQGFETRVVENACQALVALQDGPVDLVLSDINMPGESGLDLLRRIRHDEPDLDVVMVTGLTDVNVAVEAIREGAADYVTKPFNLDEVRIVIDRTLEKRRLIRENREHQERLEELVAVRTAELRGKKAEVERLYGELEVMYESTLKSLTTALDYRDNETQGHSTRVVRFTEVVARRMGIAGEDLTWLRRGALLHDVGKIGIPDAILRKSGPLDDEEWRIMRQHPEMGYHMLKHVEFLAPALDIVLCHQERWDGSGYPRGLAGRAIPRDARIFAVVDTFDAMTSDRPYRAAMSTADARREIARCGGVQFDPAVVGAFLSIDLDEWTRIRALAHDDIELIVDSVLAFTGGGG